LKFFIINFVNKNSKLFITAALFFIQCLPIYSNVNQQQFEVAKDSSTENNYLDFYRKLPEVDSLRKKTRIGKLDPFSSDRFNADSNELSYIKLLGIYKTDFSKSAILKYKNQTGEVSEGFVGGIDTLLIPKDAILKEISLNKSSIIIKIGNKDYEINL
tara:strand:+ start:237 stop:710 length:474 start_codon:yes stop_codon:yes gene_type:complete